MVGVFRVREENRVAKSYRAGQVRVAVLYPSSYEAALASLAHQSLYYLVNGREDFIADRVVFEKDRHGRVYRRSLEYGMPIGGFEVVLASLHFELDLVRLAMLLAESGVEPVRSRRRGFPVVVVGGPVATANPALASTVADVVFVGEFEPSLEAMLDKISENRGDREGMLEGLAGVDGVYVPGFSSLPVRRVYVENLDEAYHPVYQIQPLDRKPIWGRSFIVEVSRGCRHSCLFCLEGYVFKPKRDRSFRVVKKLIEDGVEANRAGKVTLYAPSFFDHSDSDRILRWLVESGLEASIPSVRVDSLTSDRVRCMVEAGQKILTVAPESGFCPLAAALGKAFNRGFLREVFAEAWKAGVQEVKMYFLLGFLDGEEKYIAEVVYDAYKAGFRRRGSVRLSVNPVVPKPHTPLQWFGFKPLGYYRRALSRLRSLLSGLGSVDVGGYDERWGEVQAVLSVGGEELSGVLERWAFYGGSLSGWRRAVREANLDVGRYLSEKPLDYMFPWDGVVDVGVSREILEDRYLGFKSFLEGLG